MKTSVLFVVLSGLLCTAEALLDPMFAGIGAVGAAVVGSFWYNRGSGNKCYERNPDNANAMARNLTKTLSEGIFGQHLVKKMVVRSIGSHLRVEKPAKALVLSFHGLTGVGKNYVAKMIANAMYPMEGMNSPHVNLFISTLHFPIASQGPAYKVIVQEWIQSSITLCPNSLFIFDEIDKMPPDVIDGIKPFIDFHENVGGRNYRKAIFIFLSNTGGKQITNFVHELWLYGAKRDDISYEDLEGLVTMGAFNEDGGLKAANIIQQNLVDHYIPFLPLERRHVRMCIDKELRDRRASISEEEKDDILNSLQYWPDKKRGIYSSSGCKRIGKKLDLFLMD
uniref:Torsin-1B n=1 Tax=Caligus clemensi TaxID=344056 RepID=C1C156_CALCM|nr:Torsin-1B precursor [Caligus clemensi]